MTFEPFARFAVSFPRAMVVLASTTASVRSARPLILQEGSRGFCVRRVQDYLFIPYLAEFLFDPLSYNS